MDIRLRSVCAPLGAVALAFMVTVAQAAETRVAATTPDTDTILGPTIVRPGADLSCGTGPAGLGPWGVDRVEQALSLSDSQRSKFSDLKAASQRALQYLKESCPTNEPATPTGRVTNMERRLEAMLEAVRTVKPALDDFYASLSDEQKARLNVLDPTALNRTADAGGAEGRRSYHYRRHWGFRLPFPIPF